MAGASDGINSLDIFDGFEIDDGFIKANQSRKRRINAENGKHENGNNSDKTLKSPKSKTPKTTGAVTNMQNSTVNSLPSLTTATSSQARASEPSFSTQRNLVTCIIVRKDKRVLPLSFVNLASPSDDRRWLI